MSTKSYKNRKENINYKNILQNFLGKNEAFAFIPNNQRDTNRFNWHSVAEELNVGHKTLKLWTKIALCEEHNKPIIGLKPGRIDEFDIESLYSPEYDYECNYECGSQEDCCGNCCCHEVDDDTNELKERLCKMRTVVIFNEEGNEIIKDMKVEQIKDFLVKEGIVEIINNKYTV